MLRQDLVNVVSRGKSVPVIGQLRVGIATVVGIVIATGAVVFIQNAAAQNRLEEGREKFRQMATVFQHPRCMNCHPRIDFPRQGDDRHRHAMNVTRGPADRGAPGLHCSTCHQSSNQTASGVPGAPASGAPGAPGHGRRAQARTARCAMRRQFPTSGSWRSPANGSTAERLAPIPEISFYQAAGVICFSTS